MAIRMHILIRNIEGGPSYNEIFSHAEKLGRDVQMDGCG